MRSYQRNRPRSGNLFADESLLEHGLPDPDQAVGDERLLVSDVFLEQLLSVDDEATRRRLIEERATLARTARTGARPTCRDQLSVESIQRTEHVGDFVAAIT